MNENSSARRVVRSRAARAAFVLLAVLPPAFAGAQQSAGAPAEPARPLTARGLENLAAFARLVGYVRFFHPTPGVLDADWDSLVVHGVRAVERAPTPDSLAHTLRTLLQPVAPSVVVTPPGAPADARPPREPRPAGEVGIAFMQHHGVGLPQPPQARATQNPTYWSTRLVVPERDHPAYAPHPDRPHRAQLGGGVGVVLPMALRVPLPKATERERMPRRAYPLRTPNPHDRATRLATVVQLWTTVQHFYPYGPETRLNWDAELVRALRSAATDATLPQVDATFARMAAALKDGQATVSSFTGLLRRPLPLALASVGDTVVVAHVADAAATALRRGDVVLAFDGVPTAAALAREEALQSAATPWHRRRRALAVLAQARGGPQGQYLTLRVRPAAGGPAREVRVMAAAQAVRAPRPDSIAELRPGVLYVDLERVTTRDLDALLPRLAGARGIVFDARGGLGGVAWPRLLARFAERRMSTPRFDVPVVTLPDGYGWNWIDRTPSLDAVAPRLTARVAWIADAGVVGLAETMLGVVERYRLGVIVGEPTAGTNGVVNALLLPTGGRLQFTGMKVRRHDGTPHHGVGIRPAVRVRPTLAGLAAGRDELLEKAVEVVGKP